jgi:cytoskeletal protein CcmA (bactofilin family)
MAVGRISGPLLKENLVRNGIDLAFETDLLYLDVNNQRIGVKTTTPTHEVQVAGTTNTTNLLVDTQANLADVVVSGSTISTTNQYLNLGTLDNVVYQNKARIDSIDIEGNVISTNSSNANLEFRPNGTGTVDVHSNMNVTGNIHATGNITADGDITIGDANTDSIILNAEIASNIIPDANNTYALGSNPATGGKEWNDVWVNNFYATNIISDGLDVDGIDLTLRQGNIIYVAENGNDANSGTHPQDPHASVKHALSTAVAGDTVHVYPGLYTEIFPLTVPAGVTVKGFGLRSVTIKATTATRYKDAFLLNGESTVEDLMITGFFSGRNNFTIASGGAATGTLTANVGTSPFAHAYVSGGTITNDAKSINIAVTGSTYNNATGILTVTYSGTAPANGAEVFLEGLIFSCTGGNRTFPDNGYALRFATDYVVTSRSPYIRNITVITSGSTTTAEDPRGFNAGDAGKGAYIDGAYATTASKEASMLFHSATFITPGVDAIVATNGVRVEWLNSFTYFAKRSFHAYDSNDGKYSNGKTRIRLGGVSGTFAAGNTVTFTSADASTVATATVESVVGDILVVDGKNISLIGFDTTPQSISNGSGATATSIINYDLRDFGAEIRMIGSASVYGDFGLVGDGPGVIFYAIGHNLAYIGTGKEVSNQVTEVIQANEVVELNGAKVRYNSVDHKGDFRVGDLFYVNQEDGTVSFSVNALNIDLTQGVTFNTGGSTSFISGERIDTGNIRITGNTVSSTSGDITFDAQTDQINLQDNVAITGDLAVTGDVSIGGNIVIGDEASDTIQIVAGINSNLIPATDNSYSLGTDSNIWLNLYVDEVEVDDISISTNFITTTVSNADLELRANGTGKILVPSNNVQVDNNLTVSGLSTLANTNITGTVTLVGNLTETGNLDVTGDVSVTQALTADSSVQFEEILVDGNVISTTTSNADLELRANGSGSIIIPSNDVTITNDLAVSGTLSVANINVTGTVQANTFSTGNILIDDNFITTTVSNSNLELRANGTGKIVFEDFSFDSNVIETTGDLVLQPSTQYVKINSTGALKLPVGTTAQRPTAAAGQIRFNSTLARFEGYNGTAWLGIRGVEDLDGDTKVTAELTDGANDNTIRFNVSGATIVDIDATRLNAPRITVDNIQLDGNVISTITADTDLQFTANGTGSVVFDNFAINGNSITNISANAVTTFENTNGGYVKFDGTYGMVLPVGTSENRPVPAYRETGMMRFNSQDSRVEVFDGTSWVSVAGSSGSITAIDAEDIAITMAVIFG